MHEESIFIVEMLVTDIRFHIFLLNCIKQIVHFSYYSEHQLSVLMIYLNHTHGGEREKKYLKLKLIS